MKAIFHKVLTAVGTLICIIVLPLLVINCTLIVKSLTNDGEIPSIAGFVPFVVLTDSMFSEIESGDMLIFRTAEADEIETGDVIAFYDPAGNGLSVVTHRVIEIIEEEGELFFRTKGDANNTADAELVPATHIIGTSHFRIPAIGNAAVFVQTTRGILICIVLPLLVMAAYDFTRRRIHERAKRVEEMAMLAELNEFRRKSAGL